MIVGVCVGAYWLEVSQCYSCYTHLHNGLKKDPGNYRSVSLISVSGKIVLGNTERQLTHS